MSRSTTPPGDMGTDARHGLPDQVAGAQNADGITSDMRKGPASQPGLDTGPELGSRGEYKTRNYTLAKRPKASKAFIRMDR